VGPRDPSVEPQVRSATTSGPRPTPKVSLPIAPSAGAAGAAIGYFRFLNDCAFTLREVFDPCLLLVLGTGDAGAIILVGHRGARNDTSMVNCLERISCAKVSFFVIFVIYLCLPFLGIGLGKISEYTTSRACCGAIRGQRLTASRA
jgi:hypothetical protein